MILATINSLDEARTITAEIPVPLMVNLNATGALKDCGVDDLRQAGVRVALYPSVVRNAVVGALQTVLTMLREEGHQPGLAPISATTEEHDRLLETSDWQRLNDKYAR